MKNIGFYGGGLILELGPVADVRLFFDCISAFVSQRYPERGWHLLTDRLYRRYVTQVDLDATEGLMKEVRKHFCALQSSSVNWSATNDSSAITCLDQNKPTLDKIFERYFSSFHDCAISAKINYEGFKSYPGYRYQPVQVVVSDIPEFFEDKSRALEDYDALGPTDPPFWLR